jgi:hypothetical protein
LLTLAVTTKGYWNTLLVPDLLQAVSLMHRHSACLTPPILSIQDDCRWVLSTIRSLSVFLPYTSSENLIFF